MLNLQLDASRENLRSDFQKWIRENPPPVLKKKDIANLEKFIEVGRAWQSQLSKDSWVGLHWPKACGGRGLSLVEEAVIQEELAKNSSPQLLGLFGLTMVGPVLIQHGSESQQKRFLPKILNASEIWCQGFSEPGAGSDLANIRTRASVSKDGFIVNGQKVWTSFAQIADWCFLLCRTSDSGKKHEGLSYLLVNMKQAGITIRPLKQISGDDEFNEVFFDNVIVPLENVVGAVGDGWKIAISTLMYERIVLTFSRMLQSEVALRELIADYRTGNTLLSAVELSREVAWACAVRALAYEQLAEYSQGKKPGPEGSMIKLMWSESFQSIAKLGVKVLGMNAQFNEKNETFGPYLHRYLYSRGRTIAAGTSEIQRNIIAERILGLPRSMH